MSIGGHQSTRNTINGWNIIDNELVKEKGLYVFRLFIDSYGSAGSSWTEYQLNVRLKGSNYSLRKTVEFDGTLQEALEGSEEIFNNFPNPTTKNELTKEPKYTHFQQVVQDAWVIYDAKKQYWYYFIEGMTEELPAQNKKDAIEKVTKIVMFNKKALKGLADEAQELDMGY